MRKKILIIEDNADIRENVVEILDLAGYEVFEADNGKNGVEEVFRHTPDLILCDIMMPELDGYGVLYMLNKHPQAAAIPFIFLTAKTERVDVRKAMEMGADDFLAKPFDDIELLNAIEIRLKKRDQQQNYYSKSLDRLNHLVSGNNGMAELKKIIQERKCREVRKNQVLYYEGDKGSGLYLLITGKIKATKLAENGRELMTGIYSPDDFIGVQAILAQEPYTDTARAIEDSVVCPIPAEQIDQLLNVYPDLSRSFIKLLASDIREKEDQLLQLAYHSVRKRMARTILRLQNKEANGEGIKISRDDLAALAGMATETVSRTLTDFKNEGLIDKDGCIITIKDQQRLEKMKN